MRSHAIFRTLALATALALLPACDSTEPRRPLQPGTYQLTTVDGNPLPASLPCGLSQVLERRIVLEGSGSASYTSREILRETGAEVTYHAQGVVLQRGDALELAMRGRWLPRGAEHEVRLRVLPEADGLTQTGVGMECDGSSTLRYRIEATP